ncbi:thiolase family protein [Halorubrum trueperi]|uniref:Thiolase family protein n=1 Tax=Halorubrum trueperi TaxID=2004704 RepID=A0ABD5UGU2_9EURY
MRDVYIAGVGQTQFGELDRDVRQLGADAVQAALDDAADRASVSRDDLDVAFVGNVGGPADRQRGIVGQVCLREAGISGISITNVENACSSSACAVRLAYRELAAGLADVAIVLGVEKMTGVSTEEATGGLAAAADVARESDRGLTFPSVYAMRANAYADRHGDDDLREALAQISVKNHRNALDNPRAHFHREITKDDVLESPVIADPMRLYDMCPNSDGAAAAVLVADDFGTPNNAVAIEAAVHRTGTYDQATTFGDPGKVGDVADVAYDRSGLGPDDVDLFEVHDGSTMGELLNYEALGIAAPGDGPEAILSGRTERDGPAPVNPSGGLKARGHPVGATGVAQIAELTWQLRGEANDRQVPNATVGLAENAGGALNGVGANTTIHILRAR